MNMKFTKLTLFLLLFVPVTSEAVATKYTNSCTALAKESGKYPEKKVKGYPSDSIFKKMSQANQLMSEGGASNKAQALALINEVKNSTKDKFTLSVVYQYLARDAYEKDNFSQAVNYAQQVVNLDALPVNAILSMKKQVAWSYLGKKDFKSAISWMKQYFDQVINPPVSDYKALAQLYYQDENYRAAICPLFIALKKTEKKKDKEAIYKMLFNAHYTLKDLAGSAKILSEIINFYPNNKDYWQQLYSIYYQMGDQVSALAVNELAYKKGLWTKESEIKNLSSFYVNNGSPLIAAIRLEDGIKSGTVSRNEENLKLIARYYDQAKERDKAIQAYKNLSNISSKGVYAYKIGNNYYDVEDYTNAIKYFTEAVNKGGLKSIERGNAFLQMAAAHFYQGNENAAIRALEQAKSVDKVRKNATSWIAYIKQKQEIRELLRKDAEALEAEVAAEKAEAEARVN